MPLFVRYFGSISRFERFVQPLSQTTLNFINHNRLINQNYKFQSHFQISIKDILMGLSYDTYEDVRLEILPILIEVFIHLSFCRRKAFYEDRYNKINDLDNYKGNIISRFKTLSEIKQWN